MAAPATTVTAEPIDGVELTFHGVTDNADLFVAAEVTDERPGYWGHYIYTIVDIETADDGTPEQFVAAPEGPRRRVVEDAIEACGGTVRL